MTRVRRIAPIRSTEKKKVAAYCRVSTNRSEQEESLDTQVRAYRRMISTNSDWQLAEIYVDKGRSGTSANKRPAFQKMMSDARNGRIDLILVKSISRFARNVADGQRYVQELRDLNIFVHFEKENIRTEDPTSAFIFSLLSTVAQDESRSISENVKWSYQKRYARGEYNLGNNKIYGYDCIGGILVPNKNAPIVREIFKLFSKGKTCSDIASHLKKKRVKSLRGHDFTVPTIMGMLQNETYVGDKLLQKQAPVDFLTKRPDPTLDYNSYYLRDDHRAIVDRKTWESVQSILEQHKSTHEKGLRIFGEGHHVL